MVVWDRKRIFITILVSSFLALSGLCVVYSSFFSAHSPVFPSRPKGFVLFDESGLRNQAAWGCVNVHDPSIFYDMPSGFFYVYSTDLQKGMYVTPGCQIRRSRNLIEWEFVGWALPDGIPEAAAAWANPVNLWAPDCVKVDSKYRLYYSASLFGKQQSAIGLAVAANPGGPFVSRALVLKTRTGDPVNAIDPAIVTEVTTGNQYMVYGSFWGGIRLVRLDRKTGLLAAGETGFGVSLAVRSAAVSGAVEGPYIIFNHDTGYYYLFVSYGSLFSNYNVRVGRSRSIAGPYLDYNGIALTDLAVSSEQVGYKLTTGFRFANGQGWFALGHNSVIEHDGNYFLVNHARPEGGQSWAYLNVRKLLWTESGWPVANPLLYAGESAQPIDRRFLVGKYECVLFADAPAFDVTASVPLVLKGNGSFVCATTSAPIRGRWKLSGLNRIDLSAGDWSAEVYALASWDRDQDAPAVSLTGLDCNGHCLWARQSVSLP